MQLRNFGLSIFMITALVASCKRNSETNQQPESISAENGEKLARLYCASCHQFPEPEMLPKKIWSQTILPRMGYMYGIYNSETERQNLFENNQGGAIVKASGLFPDAPTLDSITWANIQKYYLTKAPDSIFQHSPLKIIGESKLFKTLIPDQKVNVPSTTLAKFTSEGTIYIGDAFTKSFSEFSKDLGLLKTGNVPEGAVWTTTSKDTLWLTVMGSFSPTDAPLGVIAKSTGNGPFSVPIKNLQRPVHTSLADVDQDGDEDILVCEFGKWTGALSLHVNQGEDTYVKKVLHAKPGAIKAYFRDMNADGLMDIIALFAQADEGIDIFYNLGNTNFRRERVLEFPPSMGGSFFNVQDYNHDGHLDILFTAGDNADYYPILKPWHGVYLYTNNGSNVFKKTRFLPLNGAYNAVMEDFDLDGDQDIAAISFFPDWAQNPKEAFVFFENIGTTYQAYTFKEVNWGRWVVMDAMDYDRDGDTDLVLGSLAFEALPKLGFEKVWMEKGIPFVVLENQSR
ncbi:MAG: hypothetical protein CL596_00410 [Alteromonas sp.]|nr:hypothetical protein [Alteromonas sp.]